MTSTAAQPDTIRRSFQIGVIVTVLTTLFCLGILIRHQFDPLVFVEIGPLYNEGITGAENGYDGQFAYYIATEGFNATPKLDQPPAFRYQRIVYPALSAVLALGQRALIPWTMLLINIVAHGMAAGILAYLLATRTRASPWWALVPALWVGTLMSIRLDLNEPLAIALSLLGVASYLQGRLTIGAILFALAGLTKDVGLVLAGGLFLYEISQRQWWRGIRLAFIAVLPFGAWLVFLRLWLGPWVNTSLDGIPRLPSPIPFAGLVYAKNALEFGLIAVWAMLPALVILITAVQKWRSATPKPEIGLAIAACVFVAFTPPATINELISTLRILQPLLVASLLLIAVYYPRRLVWFGALWAPSVILALLIAYY